MTSETVFYKHPGSINLDFDLDTAFPGFTSSNITEVTWSLKKTSRDADNLYVLKTFTGGGVVVSNTTAANGQPLIRFSVTLNNTDWNKLTEGEEYLLFIGFKLNSQGVNELSYLIRGEQNTLLRILFARRGLTV
jgi:hypothetical protein